MALADLTHPASWQGVCGKNARIHLTFACSPHAQLPLDVSTAWAASTSAVFHFRDRCDALVNLLEEFEEVLNLVHLLLRALVVDQRIGQ